MNRWASACLVFVVLAGCSDPLQSSVSIAESDSSSTVTSLLAGGSTSTSSTSSSSTTVTWVVPDESEPIPLGPLAPREGASVVWTGYEMVVWGGCEDRYCKTRFADGAAYDPITNRWRMIADSPLEGRNYHLTTWTGSEMIIVGGTQSNRTAAAYMPSTDSWRLLPDTPFAVGYERLDGSVLRDYVGAVWTGTGYIIWSPHVDRVSAYSPETDSWADMASTGLEVDLGVLRWNGTDLVALGALTAVYPNPVPLQGVRLVDQKWEALPSASLRDDRYNIGARPHLSGWAGDALVTFTDSGSEAGRTMTYSGAENSWTQIDSVPLPGSEAWPEPLPIGERLLVFHYGGAAIYDPASGWLKANSPYAEAGRAVWTGQEVLFWGYGTTDTGSFEMRAWRFTPPSP